MHVELLHQQSSDIGIYHPTTCHDLRNSHLRQHSCRAVNVAKHPCTPPSPAACRKYDKFALMEMESLQFKNVQKIGASKTGPRRICGHHAVSSEVKHLGFRKIPRDC